MSDCEFTSCQSQWGAGLWIEQCNTTGSSCDGSVSYGITHDSSFTTCKSISSWLSGGTLSVCANPALTIHSCSFTSNMGLYGAGISWPSPDSTQYSRTTWMYECLFFNNTASVLGHDVYFFSKIYSGISTNFHLECFA